MKRTVLLIFNLTLGIFLALSQNNVWSGDFEVNGSKIPLVFHLNEENPSFDSPAQRTKGIPIQFQRVNTDSVVINIPSIGATYKGKFAGDLLSGKFSQRGYEFPLVLHRGEKITNRPQTPVPPYPYSQEEVSFNNGDAFLKGTLTLPEGFSRETPVVIMITGSGLQNRDEEISDHKPFAVIADALARNGIGSLRYDDRGFGESTGDAVNCTTGDLKNDALAGINLLRERFKKVGALGHSEGATIALMLAAENKVDFCVSLAGMVISGKELLMAQNRNLLSQAGLSENVINQYCNLLELAFNNDESLPLKLESSDLPVGLKQNIQAGLQQLKTPYMQYFLSLDLRDKLKNITSPVLALNGKKDTQVFFTENLEPLRRNLPSNAFNKIMALDGLNHLFQHCTTGSTNEYCVIEETISPEVLEIIGHWINSL